MKYFDKQSSAAAIDRLARESLKKAGNYDPSVVEVAKARTEIRRQHPELAESERRQAGQSVREESPETVSDAIRAAVDRRAVTEQLSPGQLSTPIWQLRASIWKTEIGRKLMALDRSLGSQPYSSVRKDVGHQAALGWVEKWRE